MKPISLFPLLAVVSLLGACAAFEGKEYSVNAYDARGRMLNKRFEMDSNKAGIPVARSVLCSFVQTLSARYRARLQQFYRTGSQGIQSAFLPPLMRPNQSG